MRLKLNLLFRILRRYILRKPNPSLLLFIATIAAMILANSPWAFAYHHMLSFPIEFQIGTLSVFSHGGEPMTMLEFVNDALMAIFFFMIGLEIKQEILMGELSSLRKALMPVFAALGGMIVPVLCYLLVCSTQPEAQGAAIPMATDIAFALAVLALLGNRVPLGLRIFLTALAVVDDIGGIIVIALFYSGHIAYEPLLVSMGLLMVMFVGCKMRVDRNLFYYIFGFFVWFFFLESGIHPTIAGVLVALTVPLHQKIEINDFTGRMRSCMDLLDQTNVKSDSFTPAQLHLLNDVHSLVNKMISPLQSIMERLHPTVNYVILPMFAFVNSGVTFGDIRVSSLFQLPLAIFVGLFLGKTIGIYLFSSIAVRIKLCSFPSGMTRKALLGISMLGGIGFTVALFIANLSFQTDTPMGADLLNQAKLGVFAGSFVSGMIGYYFLRYVLPKPIC